MRPNRLGMARAAKAGNMVVFPDPVGALTIRSRLPSRFFIKSLVVCLYTPSRHHKGTLWPKHLDANEKCDAFQKHYGQGSSDKIEVLHVCGFLRLQT